MAPILVGFSATNQRNRMLGSRWWTQLSVASMLALSPRLSTQPTMILSPGFAPRTRKFRNGFLDTAWLHCASSTVLPLCAAVRVWMKCMGTSWPVTPSLRRPVSIGWNISIFTSATLPCSCARIFIGSAIWHSPFLFPYSGAAAADRDLDFAHRGVELAARPGQDPYDGRFVHLYPGGHECFRPIGKLEYRGERLRILVHQDVNRLSAGYLADNLQRNNGSVLGDFRCFQHDPVAVLRRADANAFQRIGDRLGVECGLVPLAGQQLQRPQHRRCHRHRGGAQHRPAHRSDSHAFHRLALHCV